MKCKNMFFVLILTFVILKDTTLGKNNKTYSSSLFQVRQSPIQAQQTFVPDLISFGTCTHNEVSKSSRHCESIFFKKLIQQSHPNCKELFKIMQNCMLMAWSQCLVNQTNFFSRRDSKIPNLQSESTYCDHGALSLPINELPARKYCGTTYFQEARSCVQGYQNKFIRNPADSKLCGEYLNARNCLYRTQDNLCRYNKINLNPLKEVTRQLYRSELRVVLTDPAKCWNPFCVWRRRPVIDDSNFFDVVIPSDEQKQGIPDDCPANTAYLTMREEVSFEVKIQKNPPTSNSREPFLNVNRREEKSQNAENSDAEFERRADFFTPPSGHANKIFSPLFGWKLYFTAVLIMTLLST